MSSPSTDNTELVKWARFAYTMIAIITIKYALCFALLLTAYLYELGASYLTGAPTLWLTAVVKEWVLLVIEVLFYLATLVAVCKFLLPMLLPRWSDRW